ncbi:hypothetical protein V2J09_021653 [Rumex salicifolius]
MEESHTPFSYGKQVDFQEDVTDDDYEAILKTPEISNIDDALTSPEINPDIILSTDYYGEPNDSNPRIEWTHSEKEIFQNSLDELGFTHPQLFEQISAKIPGKSAVQVREHFDAFVQAEHIQIPDHNDSRTIEDTRQETRSEGSSQGRQMWTDEEHNLFLNGLAHYGKGEWKRISSEFVKTKTPSQVASHAQKYYNRANSNTPPSRRRYSINDTRIVDSAIVHYPTRPL